MLKTTILDKENLFIQYLKLKSTKTQKNPLMASEIYEQIILITPCRRILYQTIQALQRCRYADKSIETIDRMMSQFGK